MTDLNHPKNWKYGSPEKEGFFEIVTPENSACKLTWIFRLNLKEGSVYELLNEQLELNGVVISGSIKLDYENDLIELQKLDSFYLPAKENLKITASEDCSAGIIWRTVR